MWAYYLGQFKSLGGCAAVFAILGHVDEEFKTKLPIWEWWAVIMDENPCGVGVCDGKANNTTQ